MAPRTSTTTTNNSNSNSNSNKRSNKITIKAYQDPPKLPPNYYSITSTALLEATRGIFDNDSKASSSSSSHKTSLQDCYTLVSTLCSHQLGPQLYHDLVQELELAAAKSLKNASTAGTTTNTTILEHVVAAQYPLYVESLWLLKDMYLVLDRQWTWQNNTATKRTTSTSTTFTLVEVGLTLFAARLQTLDLHNTIYQEWLTLLWNDWNQPSPHNIPLLSATVVMWQELLYKINMITKLQVDLQEKFSAVSREWQDKLATTYNQQQFLSYCHAQWMHVSLNWGLFLPKSWLRSLLELYLIEPHLNNNYLLKDLDLHNLENMAKLWFLAGRLKGGLDRVKAAVVLHAKALGSKWVKEANYKTVIPGLLQLHDQLAQLIQTVGADSIPVKQIWSEVLNVEPDVAEYLAKYMDATLRNHKMTPPLDAILQLFSNLQAKDIFEAFYKKDLAKRLLNQKVQSIDMERQFVSLLKVECGAGYTSKMEGMFQDVEWSRETMQRWKDSSDYTVTNNIEMDVQILTTGYWPVYPQYDGLVLPETLLQPQREFWNHYKTKYQGRKIVWQYALGGCQLKYKLGNKVYDLLVSLGQTLVLMCFNKKDRWKLSDICAEIGLTNNREEAQRMLQSLSLGKEGTRVLRRISPPGTKPGPLVTEDDVFVVNDKFTSPHRRIKINNILWKETREDREKVVEGVSRDRLYLIDAVLVRIMKARKTILHQQLIPQVLEQVKVPAQPADIKKRIESLIEREYMERDEKDRNRYNYLA